MFCAELAENAKKRETIGWQLRNPTDSAHFFQFDPPCNRNNKI